MQNPSIKLVTKTAVCERLCISDRTLEKLVRARRFPAPLRLGKQVMWAEQVVESWLEHALAPQLDWAPHTSKRRANATGS
jgi:predicted DNA-binding transcriptional regulator AlpA